jgi:DNA-binding YbaB/EbfC family protein
MHNFAKMQKQARQMQAQLEKMQNELKAKFFTGVSGSGLVSVTVTGDKIVTEVKIKPECVDSSDIEGLEDLIKAACNAALAQAEEASSACLPEGFSFP